MKIKIHKESDFKLFESDRYHIIHEIGKGNFGNFYFAIDKLKEKQVIIKKIPIDDININNNDYLVDDSEINLLIKISKADTPYITKVLDYRCFNTNCFLVFDFSKHTLREILQNQNALQESKVLKIAKQMSSAFIEIHKLIDSKSFFMHRDIRPENLLINDDGNIIIADFGFGKIQSVDYNCTSMIGHLGYMAPEIYNGEIHDMKCDIYSTGIVLYECIFGKPLSLKSVPDELSREWDKTKISKNTEDLLKGMLKQKEDRLNWEQVFNHIALQNIDMGIPIHFNINVNPNENINNEDVNNIMTINTDMEISFNSESNTDFINNRTPLANVFSRSNSNSVSMSSSEFSNTLEIIAAPEDFHCMEHSQLFQDCLSTVNKIQYDNEVNENSYIESDPMMYNYILNKHLPQLI